MALFGSFSSNVKIAIKKISEKLWGDELQLNDEDAGDLDLVMDRWAAMIIHHEPMNTELRDELMPYILAGKE